MRLKNLTESEAEEDAYSKPIKVQIGGEEYEIAFSRQDGGYYAQRESDYAVSNVIWPSAAVAIDTLTNRLAEIGWF